MFDSLFCTERKPMRSAQLQLHCSKCQGETRAVLNGFSPKTYQNKRWWRVRKWACKSTSRRHKTTGSETNLEKKKNSVCCAVGLQPGDVAFTTAQMMRLLSKYFLASLPSSPLPSPPFLPVRVYDFISLSPSRLFFLSFYCISLSICTFQLSLCVVVVIVIGLDVTCNSVQY